MRLLPLLVLLLGISGIPLLAADVTGFWRFELKPDFSGHDQTLACGLKQDGTALVVDCQGWQMTGSVDGDTLTFSAKTGAQSEMTATFAGTVNNDATAIDGTWHLIVSGGEDRMGRFVLSKVDLK